MDSPKRTQFSGADIYVSAMGQNVEQIERILVDSCFSEIDRDQEIFFTKILWFLRDLESEAGRRCQPSDADLSWKKREFGRRSLVVCSLQEHRWWIKF
jgi:hypothetical protein